MEFYMGLQTYFPLSNWLLECVKNSAHNLKANGVRIMGRLKKQSVFIDIEDTVGIFYVFTYYGNYTWSYLINFTLLILILVINI